MTEVIMVPFAGEGAGSSELSWGQQHIWGAIQNLGSTMNMVATRDLGPEATVEEFVGELRFYLSRFQAMRTLLKYVPDGLPIQVVVASGEAPLEIVDIGADDDPAAAADALVAEHEERPFDYETEFPIRMTLIRRAGELTHLVTALSHFATDGAGGYAMYSDYVNRDPETGLATRPVRTQPLDLAIQQNTPNGRRHSDASLRYWEEQLRALPPRRPRPLVDTGEPRYWELEFRSPAMLLGVQAIAYRTRKDVSTVLLGVFAIALARITGDNPSAVHTLVSNRFRPGLADIVSNVSQTGLFVVDVADATVDEVVVRTQQASIKTYKNAYFDLAQWRELIEKTSSERGDDLAPCYYNDRPSQHQKIRPDHAPSPEEITEATGTPGTTKWTELPFFNEPLMVTINGAEVDEVELLVLADTWYAPKAEMEALARLMEEIAVAAALDPGLRTGVTAG